MRKQILSLAVALLIGSTVCMAQNHQKGKADREKRIEKMVTDLGLNEKQAKDFKAAMEEMKPAKNKSDEKPSREEMQKKKKEVDAKIKSILTDEPVSYTHLRAHETRHDLVCRLLLEKKKKNDTRMVGTHRLDGKHL